MGVSKRKGARRRNYGGVPRAIVIEREAKVWELTKKCKTQASIAKELGISQVSVMRIQKRVEARLSANTEKYHDHVKKSQLAALEHMAEESMAAWEKSKRPQKTMTKTIVGDLNTKEAQENAKLVTAQVGDSDEGLPGDLGYIAECRAALADIRKILGVDAPLKMLTANMEMSWMELLKEASEQANASNSGRDAIEGEATTVESET